MATVAHEQVIDLIEDLPSEVLPELVHFIEFLRFRSGQQKRAASVERVEREDAERALTLVELSRLRNIPLSALMSELELEPRGDAG